MKYAFCYLITSVLFAIQVCCGQDVIWKNSKNWKLFNIINKSGFTYSIDTLKNFQSIELNIQIMDTFMSNVSEWPKEKNSLWMGLYIATCEMEDKKVRKILISNYGGFFYDQLTKRYYEVPSELKDQWLLFLNDSMRKIYFSNLPDKLN